MTRNVKSINHQYSLRRARPLKSKYFLKHVFTASQNFIMGTLVAYCGSEGC
jgi:hypothetical protein